MTNSNNQKLIHYIYYLGYVFYHYFVKARQRNFINSIGSFSVIFTLDSINQIFQTLIIQQNIFVFTMADSCNNNFFDTLCFFMLTTIIY